MTDKAVVSDQIVEAFETPRCDKCGLEVTTGMMVMFCPKREQCEFWDDEWTDDIKAFVRNCWNGTA